jgi:Flp pilus assembly protein TadG
VTDSCVVREMPKLSQTRATRILRYMRFGDHGGAIVEMALVVPMLLTLITGIFSLGIALYQKLQLAEAVSAGGRVMAVERGQNDPCTDTANAIYAASPGLSQSNLTLTMKIGHMSGGAFTSSTSYTAAQGSAPTCTGAGLNGPTSTALTAGWGAQIVATYPCAYAVYGLHLGSCSIATQVTEVIQ